MDCDSLFADLSALTGELRPGPGARDGDLQEARTLTAYDILQGRGAARTTALPFGYTSVVSGTGPADPTDASALLNIAESAIAGLAANPAAFADIRIFRREHPILTPQLPDSVPPWAAVRSGARLGDVAGGDEVHPARTTASAVAGAATDRHRRWDEGMRRGPAANTSVHCAPLV